jgi:hypothetical protein
MDIAGWGEMLVARLESAGLPLHSFAAGDGERILLERYWLPCGPELAQSTHSVTKSFTSMAVGLAIGSGALTRKTRVGELLQPRGGLETRLAEATVADLLTMRSGHGRSIGGDVLRLCKDSWLAVCVAPEMVYRPGEHFVYSSGTSHLLSAMVQSATGRTVFDLLDASVFQPMGYENHSWQRDPEGITAGGNGLNLRLRDLWKWGQLCLLDGRFRGETLLPENWVAEATRPAVAFDALEEDGVSIGYGDHVWCGPRGAYFASGIFGQNCIVVPDLDLVVAFTAGLTRGDHLRLLRLLFDSLPRPEGRRNRKAMADTPKCALAPLPPALPWRGNLPPKGCWSCSDNPMGISRISMSRRSDKLIVALHDENGEHAVTSGVAHWHAGRTNLPFWFLHHSYQPDDIQVVATASRNGGEEIRLEWSFPETPFRDTVHLTLDGEGGFLWTHRTNVNSSATEYSMSCRPLPTK